MSEDARDSRRHGGHADAWRGVLVTESTDPMSPYFGWWSPGFDVPGWRAWPLPTVDAVQLLGPTLYRRALLQIIRELRPHVLLTHPPFDFLDAASRRIIRRHGTRIVGWLDEETMPSLLPRLGIVADSCDSLVSPLPLSGETGAGTKVVRSARWALSPAAVGCLDASVPEFDVVLFAPHRPEREALAHALVGAGHSVACFGPGWALGSPPRPVRLGLMRRAAAVLIFADQPLALVEAALVDARFVAERGAALDAYLPVVGAPARFAGRSECLALLADPDALPTCSSLPSRASVLAEIVAGIELDAPRSAAPRTTALAMLHAVLAHTDEHRGRLERAEAASAAWAALAPGQAEHAACRARLARTRNDTSAAVEYARAACARVPAPQAMVRDLCAFLPLRGPGRGLGVDGGVDRRAALRAQYLATLVDAKRFFAAVEVLRPWSEQERVAVRAALAPTLGNPESLLLDRILAGTLPVPPPATGGSAPGQEAVATHTDHGKGVAGPLLRRPWAQRRRRRAPPLSRAAPGPGSGGHASPDQRDVSGPH